MPLPAPGTPRVGGGDAPTGNPLWAVQCDDLLRQVFLMERLYMRRELYFSVVLDRTSSSPIIVASTCGGTSIEDVAARSPELILKVMGRRLCVCWASVCGGWGVGGGGCGVVLMCEILSLAAAATLRTTAGTAVCPHRGRGGPRVCALRWLSRKREGCGC